MKNTASIQYHHQWHNFILIRMLLHLNTWLQCRFAGITFSRKLVTTIKHNFQRSVICLIPIRVLTIWPQRTVLLPSHLWAHGGLPTVTRSNVGFKLTNLLKNGILSPTVQLFTSGFCIYTYLKSLISCSRFLCMYYFTALFTLSRFIFIPLFLLHSCKCPGLLSQKTTSTVLRVHIHFCTKAEPDLKLLTLFLKYFLLPFSKTCLQKIPRVNSLQFPTNLQVPPHTACLHFLLWLLRHWPNIVHGILDKKITIFVINNQPKVALICQFLQPCTTVINEHWKL